MIGDLRSALGGVTDPRRAEIVEVNPSKANLISNNIGNRLLIFDYKDNRE